MKATVATRLSIAATREEVFKYLTDLRYHYLWNPQVRKISTTEKVKLGSHFTTESQILGVKIRAKNVVTELDPPVKFSLENKLGTVRYLAKFRLKSDGNKTLVRLATTVEADNSIGFFTVPVLKQLALRELKTDLHALKVAVENQLH
ncbi:MAG TPA: SRPBCC family protein [Candidatus Saccharimonadales bacterium]|nr:SRPBCC family protein [Candidatus Saccharimonadales bacterium]